MGEIQESNATCWWQLTRFSHSADEDRPTANRQWPQQHALSWLVAVQNSRKTLQTTFENGAHRPLSQCLPFICQVFPVKRHQHLRAQCPSSNARPELRRESSRLRQMLAFTVYGEAPALPGTNGLGVPTYSWANASHCAVAEPTSDLFLSQGWPLQRVPVLSKKWRYWPREPWVKPGNLRPIICFFSCHNAQIGQSQDASQMPPALLEIGESFYG